MKYQVDDKQLSNAISNHGNDIAAVVSTFGTTQLGNIEDLAERDSIKELRANDVWLHIDAAFGGYSASLSSHINTEIPDSDSITIDPYKFIGKPGVALLLVDKEKTPKVSIPYYSHSHFTLNTTLSAGPVAAWYQTLIDCGDYVMQFMADECIRIAYIAGEQAKENNCKLVNPVKLSIAPVQLGSRQQANYVHDKLLSEGFNVGKIHIEGRDYVTDGLRIVITPKVSPEVQAGSALEVASRISRLSSKFSQAFL